MTGDHAVDLHPYDGRYLTDPSAVWRELHDSGARVVYARDLGLWLLTRHSDVRAALADAGTFSNALTLAPVYEMCPQALAIVRKIDAPPTTAAADAPTHTRTRAALRSTFPNTASRVDLRYGKIVQARVAELVDQLGAGGHADLVVDFASVLPLYVICDILGVPNEDTSTIRRWSDGQIALIWGRPSPAEQVRLAEGLLSFWHYCQDLVAARLANDWRDPRAVDFVSTALRYRHGDDTVLTEAEVASLAFNLLVAGHETTSGLIAHVLDLALSEPGEWARLATEPDRIPTFVEETLRYRPPIDGWLRVTTREVHIGQTTIPAGARVLLMLGAANRDPAMGAAPDQFDSGGPPLRDHLSFGHGPHYCIGAALARIEAQTALTQLTQRRPQLRLASTHHRRYLPNVAFRTLQSLQVDLGPVPQP